MRLGVGMWAVLLSAATSCVHYGTQTYNTVSVAATIQAPAGAQTAAPGPTLGNVPDVPTVGSRVEAATIRDTLYGAGEWVDDESYGMVWYPSQQAVGTQFVPYGTNGYWTPTDAGWYWNSGYSWGWLTFHYGRWVMVSEQWAWVPGGLFAPAWVDWRVGDGWVGWAPLPPSGATFSAPYAFCQYSYLAYSDVWTRAVYGAGAASIYPLTTTVAPTYGMGGAVYSWGPSHTDSSTPRPVLVPIATAWNNETAQRPTTVVAQTVAHPPQTTTVPTRDLPQPTDPNVPSRSASPLSATAQAQPITSVGQGVAPHGPVGIGANGFGATPGAPLAMRGSTLPVDAPVSAVPSVAVRVPARDEPVTIISDPGAVGLGRYRTSDTVVIRSSVPIAPRETVSLGTTESYSPVSSTYANSAPTTAYGNGSPGYGASPAAQYAAPAPYAGSGYSAQPYAHPSYGPAPVAAAGPAYAPPSVSHAGYGSSAYAAPSYAAPSYAAPSYGGAVHSSVSAPAAATYTAPAATAYRPVSAPAAYRPGASFHR